MGKEKLRNLFWDRENPYSDDDVYLFLLGKKNIPGLNQKDMIARMLVTIRWYDLIDIFGIENMLCFLDDDILSRLWKEEMRSRYHYVRETLQHALPTPL